MVRPRKSPEDAAVEIRVSCTARTRDLIKNFAAERGITMVQLMTLATITYMDNHAGNGSPGAAKGGIGSYATPGVARLPNGRIDHRPTEVTKARYNRADSFFSEDYRWIDLNHFGEWIDKARKEYAPGPSLDAYIEYIRAKRRKREELNEQWVNAQSPDFIPYEPEPPADFTEEVDELNRLAKEWREED